MFFRQLRDRRGERGAGARIGRGREAPLRAGVEAHDLEPAGARDLHLRFPGAVGGAGKAHAALTAAAFVHEQRRPGWAGEPHGGFYGWRCLDPLADKIAERDRRGVRVFRRRHPGFDRHLLVAEQRAGIGNEGARQAIAGIAACEYQRADERGGEHIAELERIEFVQMRARRASADLRSALDGAFTLARPERHRESVEARGAVAQRFECAGFKLAVCGEPRAGFFISRRFPRAPGAQAKHDDECKGGDRGEALQQQRQALVRAGQRQ